jgi:hypothetical protein
MGLLIFLKLKPVFEYAKEAVSVGKLRVFCF